MSCCCISRDLKDDLPGEIRRIAAFLDIPIDEARLPAIVEHCSFDYMKTNAGKTAPLGGALLGGRRRDLHPQGHQWPLAGRADADEARAYEVKARAELGEPCAAWLAGN